MKRRLGIAQALLNDPKILVLDEPTSGLDPKERVRFRNLISRMGEERIILLSTHIVSDIEHIATTILMMKAGRIIHSGSLSELTGIIKNNVWECILPEAAAMRLSEEFPVINMRNEPDGVFLRLICDEKPCKNAVHAKAALEDLYLYCFREERSLR